MPTLDLFVDGIDKERPELSFDLEDLEERVMHSEYSRRKDVRAAGAMLREGEGEVEARVGAAIALIVGSSSHHKWTLGGKERGVCEVLCVCNRRLAMRVDGCVRKHKCYA
jgi:hypothetical protein